MFPSQLLLQTYGVVRQACWLKIGLKKQQLVRKHVIFMFNKVLLNSRLLQLCWCTCNKNNWSTVHDTTFFFFALTFKFSGQAFGVYSLLLRSKECFLDLRKMGTTQKLLSKISVLLGLIIVYHLGESASSEEF